MAATGGMGTAPGARGCATGGFDLQGHRGARGLYPENTLAGFVAAIALGVTTLELDVGMTADGVVVVSHDPALNPSFTRTPDGRWLDGTGPLIRTLCFAELSQFDVGRSRPGSAYAAAHPGQQSLDGARIPSLESVLRLDAPIRLNIELKTFPDHPDWTVAPPMLAEAVVRLVDGAGAVGRVIVQSFDWRGPLHLRRTRPDIALSWLTDAETVADSALWWDGAWLAEHGGSVPAAVAAASGTQPQRRVWAPDHAGLTEALIAQAHDRGLAVVPWTVNRPEEMRRLIRWGVDGLISDRPDLVLSLLDRGMMRGAGARRAEPTPR